MTLCTERFTCCLFGTTTAVTTAVVVAAAAVVAAVVITLTHRYHAVRGHRTGSNNLYSSSSDQCGRNIMRLFMDDTHARGAQIRYFTRTCVCFFGEKVVVPQAVGHLAVRMQ